VAGVDLRVDGEGDVVAEAVYGAAEEVEAWAEVGDCGWGEGSDGSEGRVGFSG